MVVAGAVWDWVQKNDYLAVSCGCNSESGPTTEIWKDFTIDKIPEDDGDREGKLLKTVWCDVHGGDYCAQVLAGKTKRAEVTEKRVAASQEEMEAAIRRLASQRRTERQARLTGLR
jgi:hypothetical protein